MRTIITISFILLCAACGGSDNDNGDDVSVGDDGPSGELCTDTCVYAHDGECDDGGPGAAYDECTYGTDCDDCGPRPNVSTCGCDETTGCEAGCVCDPECGGGAIGSPCSCGPSEVYCSDTNCETSYCLWEDGFEGYCSQTCGSSSCPSGFECTSIVGGGEWCVKIPTVPNCGVCSDSSDCQTFPGPGGVTIEAGCFNGRCRMKCSPGTDACDCVPGTPSGGTGTGYCADDGC